MVFAFRHRTPNDFSLFIQLATTVLPFFAVYDCKLGSLRSYGRGGPLLRNHHFMSIALVPYILFQLIAIGLSNVMALSEGIF